MRRVTALPLVSAAIVLVAATLVAPAAQAEPVVVSRSGLPDGFSLESGNGIDPTDSSGDGGYAHVTGSAALFPPSGLGALRLTSTGTSTAALQWAVGDPDSLVASWAVVRSSSATPFNLVASMTKPSGTYYGIATPAFTSGRWGVVDLVAPTYAWFTATLVSQGSDTLADFADRDTVNDGATAATLSVRQPVAATGSVLVDTVRVSTGDPGTTYDFEAPLTTTTMTASKSTITAGGSVLLSTKVSDGPEPLAGVPAVLWAKAFGESAFSMVAAVPTDAEGRASLSRAPARRTEFQWRFPGTDLQTSSQSPIAAVGVRTRVTLTLLDASLSPGQTLRARGTTFPAKPGVTATLWRTTASGRTRIGSAIVKVDGSYAINRTVTKGTWRVHVTVAASGGNLVGTSVTRTATVG